MDLRRYPHVGPPLNSNPFRGVAVPKLTELGPSSCRFYTCGQLCFQRRLAHDLEWWSTAQAHPAQVLWICYEDLLREPSLQLRRLATLLELVVSDAGVARISAAVQLDEAKRRYLSHEGMKMMLRTGGSGRYREYFSAADLAFFDEEVMQPLRAAGVPLVES